MMVVDYSTRGESFLHGKPRAWSDTPLSDLVVGNLDMAGDGSRLVVTSWNAPEAAKEPPRVTILLNFFDELQRRIPAK